MRQVQRAGHVPARIGLGRTDGMQQHEIRFACPERGGDIGSQGRGLLALPYETALFALQPGGRSAVVETDFGFHVIERLPD